MDAAANIVVNPKLEVDEEDIAVNPKLEADEEDIAVTPKLEVDEETIAVAPKTEVDEENIAVTPKLDVDKVILRYLRALKRLFIFDYDGTLTPIINNPFAAKPTQQLIMALNRLSQDRQNTVWIVSGRDQNFLLTHFGHLPGLGLSAEHGAFMRYPGSSVWDDLTEDDNMLWQQRIVDIFNRYNEEVPGSFIEGKHVAITWHYRNAADQILAASKAGQCRDELQQKVAKKYDLEIMEGKANIEVRPKYVSKGAMVEHLLHEERWMVNVAHHRSSDPANVDIIPHNKVPAFVLCMGDDRTDEDMFRVLEVYRRNGRILFNVFVGPETQSTFARWCVPGPAHVLSLIEKLIDAEPLSEVARLFGDDVWYEWKPAPRRDGVEELILNRSVLPDRNTSLE